MKRIIFDIDNTLIPWKSEYVNSVLDLLDNYKQYTYKDGIKIYNELSHHSDVCYKLDIDDISNRLNIDKNFLLDILEAQKSCVEEADDSIKSTLEYLSSKYELVILTNWFKSVQVERLKKAGIYHYFKEIYCSDEYPSKPSEEAFMGALNGTDIKDAIMIGDNLDIDIKPAIKLGIKSILITKKKVSSNKYSVIHNISELKEML